MHNYCGSSACCFSAAVSKPGACNTHQRPKQNMVQIMSLSLDMPIHRMTSHIHKKPNQFILSRTDWSKAGSECLDYNDQQGVADQRLRQGVVSCLSCQVLSLVQNSSCEEEVW